MAGWSILFAGFVAVVDIVCLFVVVVGGGGGGGGGGVYSSLAKKKLIASAGDIKKRARIFISGTQTTKCMKKQSESVSAFQPSIIFPAPQA